MPALFALFIRSLRDDMRSKALLWARTGLAVAVLFSIFKARVIQFSVASGLEYFESVVWTNFGFIVIAGLSYFASAITEEKEEGTLGLLRMTDLSPLSILLGKSTSRFIGGALLLLVQLPFALLAITLGGVHMDQVTGSYALLLALLFFACNAGLLASVISRRTGVAGVWSGVLMAAWAGWMYPDAIDRLLSVRGAQWSVFAPCIWVVGGGVAAFATSLALFNRCCTEAGEAGPALAVRKMAGVEVSVARRPRRAEGDAIAWRDYRFLHGGPRVIAFKSVVYFVAAIWIFAETGIGRWGMSFEEFFIVLMFWSIVALACESAFAASRIYRIERKDRTLSALLILPVDLEAIIRSKRRAVARSLVPVLLAMAVSGVALLGPFLREAAGSGALIFYAPQIVALLVLQFYFNLRLVAWFSLRMKWGGLPTSLALSWVANSIAAFFAYLMFQQAALLILIIATAFASVMMKNALRFRIEEAAAGE